MADAVERANQRNALIAGFLGWTLDAFDFFILTFVLADVAREFHRSIPAIEICISSCMFSVLFWVLILVVLV